MGGWGGVLILNVEEVKGVKHTHHQSSDTKNVISFKVSDRGFILDTKKKPDCLWFWLKTGQTGRGSELRWETPQVSQRQECEGQVEEVHPHTHTHITVSTSV